MLAPALPTAHTSLASFAVTPCSELVPVPTLGVATMVHVLPFQCSARVRALGIGPVRPTAHMLLGLSAATASRSLIALAVFGLATWLTAGVHAAPVLGDLAGSATGDTPLTDGLDCW